MKPILDPGSGLPHIALTCIDPGPKASGFLTWFPDDPEPLGVAEQLGNEPLFDLLRVSARPSCVAVEMVACYGMAVGAEVFETCLAIGRIVEICAVRGIECRPVYRRDIKLHLCGSARAKDGNIRQALIDIYGAPGTKKSPGKIYGISGHLWAALALAHYVSTSGK